jgi:hypothetical protein
MHGDGVGLHSPEHHLHRHVGQRPVLAPTRKYEVAGFRSSFREWAGNETSYPRDLIETALAHVEQAYRCSGALEKRRKLMEAWAGYCQSGQPAKVIPMRR